MGLAEYVIEHSERGACQCGRCVDAPDDPASKQPAGHTADLGFFKVALRNNPTREEFAAKIRAHTGEFCECKPLDGGVFDYIGLGGWIGDQGLAMQFMGLGALLGMWHVLPSPGHPAILAGPYNEAL